MVLKPDDSLWCYADEANLSYMKLRYADRKALGDEAIAKRKALADMTPDNPFYHRAASSAENAQLRWDMAYILGENEKLREMIGTVEWLHQQVTILQGAYQHTKMLAEKSRIDYAVIDSGLTEIRKLKEELTNGAKQGSERPDGAES